MTCCRVIICLDSVCHWAVCACCAQFDITMAKARCPACDSTTCIKHLCQACNKKFCRNCCKRYLALEATPTQQGTMYTWSTYFSTSFMACSLNERLRAAASPTHNNRECLSSIKLKLCVVVLAQLPQVFVVLASQSNCCRENGHVKHLHGNLI